MQKPEVVQRANRRRQRRFERADRGQRRPLNTERLESRLLMASDFQNAVNPYDVNVDGYVAPMDAAIVLSDMRRYGIRQLTASAGKATGAEGEGASQILVDVNGDGFLTPLDALQVLRKLAEPAPGDPQVQYRLFLTNAVTGQPVTAVNVGDTILARFTHQDIRDPNDPRFPDLNGDPANKGLFASYIDVVSTSNVSLVTGFFPDTVNRQPMPGANETFDFGPTYEQFNFFSGQFPTIGSGRIQDLGGLLTDVLTIPGPNEFDLVTMAFRVNSATPRAQDDNFNVEENSASNELTVLSNDSISSVVNIKGEFADGQGNEVLTYLADDPQTNPESQKVPEDEIIFPSVNLPITNASLSGLTIVSTSVGSASVDTNGTTTGSDDTILYTPPAGFNGQATITYSISDGVGATVTATATVSIGPVNDPPINSVPGTQSVDEDVQLAFSTTNGNRISISDADAGAGAMRVDLNVSSGALNVAATSGVIITGNNSTAVRLEGQIADINTALNTLTYLGNVNFNGQDRLIVVTNDNGNTGDGGALTDTDTVTINVQPVNDAPINTVPVAQLTDEDTDLIFSTANGNAISVTDVDAGTNTIDVSVTLTGSNPGSFTFSTLNGLSVQSGANGSSSVTVRGTVDAINTALAGSRFTPASAFIGDVTLNLVTNDRGNSGSGGAKSDSDSVLITVEPAVKPRARNDQLTVAEDSGASAPINVLGNDIPNDNAQVTLENFSQGSQGGTVARFTNGTDNTTTDDRLIYTPAPNFFGSETFTYTVNDTSRAGVDNTGTVFVTVTEVNDAPNAVDDLASTNEDTTLDIASSAVLSNDTTGTNEGAQTLTVVNVSTSVPGASVTLDGSTIRFTPPSNFNGNAVVSYTIRDNGTTNGSADPKEDTANITITVRSVNDAPVASNDTRSTAEDTSLTFAASTLTANDVVGGGADENGQTLTVTAVSSTSAQGGTVSLSNGNIIYTPAGQFNGTDTFTYTVSDNGTSDGANDPKTAVGTVTVTVTEVNDAPIVVDDNDTGIKNFTTTYEASELLANDSPGPSNESGQTLTIASVTATSQEGGTVELVGQTIRYTPASNFTGPDVITYVVQDNGTTNGVADPKSTVAHLNLNVLDFIPSQVSGFVYIDANNDGIRGGVEQQIGGVEIVLQGTDFRNVAVTRSTRTNSSGFYEFKDLAPGDYRIVEIDPHMLLDGIDTHGNNSDNTENQFGEIINDSFSLTIGILGDINSQDNNFGERGLDSNFFTIHELLASTPKDGVIAAANHNGDQYWYVLLGGWDKSKISSFSATPNSSDTQVNVTVRDQSNAAHNRAFDIDQNRVRLMGDDGNGGTVIRFEGTASDYGFTFASNSEGEAEGEMAQYEMAEYGDAVDAVMSESSWA